MRIVLVAAMVLAACAKPRPPAAPPEHRDNTATALVLDRVLLAEVAAGLEEVLAAMAQITAGPDCPRMGAELHQLFDRSRPLIALARAQGEVPAAAAILTAEMDARADRVRPLVESIGPGLDRCRGEAAVVDAMRQMPTF